MDEERLIVALEARIRDFEKNMLRAEHRGAQSYTRLRQGSRTATTAMEADMLRSTSRINQALASTSSRIGAFGKAFVAGAVVAGIGAITTGATQAVRALSEVQRQADRAGLSVRAFQELKFVSEQNWIDVDAMVDGLKELQLRADEFIVTGKGSGAEAFLRLGYRAQDLKRRLEEPEELFLDIISRMEDLDRAAQIRVADEVFGGTGGERFVELLAQGDEGIRKLMDRAHELGVVIEEDTIAKAAELDRKFAEIMTRLSVMGKKVVVEIGEGLVDAFDGARTGAAINALEQRLKLLGAGFDLKAPTEDTAIELENLAVDYDAVEVAARALAATIDATAFELGAAGYVDAALELEQMARGLESSAAAFRSGQTDAETFKDELEDTTTEAGNVVTALGEIDDVDLSGIVTKIGDVIGALAQAAAQAVTTRDAIADATADPPPLPIGPQNGRKPKVTIVSPLAPTSSPRPQLPSVNHSFGVPDPVTPRGGGGGGGGKTAIDDYRSEVERTREEIARLEAEAVALAAVAETGFEYGDAVDYARKKAELLYEAQAAGKELTPEMRSEIDQLATAYAKAGQAADDAADRMDKVRENTERGAQSMSDLFMSVLDGSSTAEEALWRLVQQLIQVQIESAILNLAEAGGGVGSIFEALGAALSGRRAEGGPVKVGEPYLVNERTANSEIFVPSQSGAILNVPQAQAALREAVMGGKRLPRSLRKMAAASSELVMPRIEGARANGGPVMSGKSYLTNERTGRAEVFSSSQSGAILNVPQAQAALRAGPAGQSKIEVAAPVVNIPVNVAPLPGETAEVTRQPNGSMDIRMVREIMRNELSSGSMDSAMRRRWGGRPLPKGS